MTHDNSAVQLNRDELALIRQALRSQADAELKRFSHYSDSGVGLPGASREMRRLLGKLERQTVPV